MGSHHLVSIVSTLGLSILLFLVSESLQASLKDFLLHLVGLSSHGSLVNCELSGLHNDAIDRDCHSVFNIDHIANMQEVVMEHLVLASAKHNTDVLLIGGESGLDELHVLAPVDEGADGRDNKNCNHNRSTLNPSVGSVVWLCKDHIQGQGENRSDHKDLKHKVVQGLNE